eukprot:scpid36569/ scgid2453/ Pre-mRNA-processing factor 39; PRP39 homolog
MAELMDTSTSTDATSLAAPPPATPVESTSAEETTAVAPKVEDSVAVVETPEAQFWATVKENPSDFDTWVKLLQIVEQQDKTFAAREAFDTFLAKFPFCYGYWKKYADYEQRQSGNATAKEVYRRGLTAVPLSIDLWMQYATFTEQTSKASDLDKIKEVKAIYDAAIATAGLDFRSDRLWETYIDWLKNLSCLKDALDVFDQVLCVPTQQYSKHFDRFKELVTSQRPVDILSDEEYSQLYHEVNAAITAQEALSSISAVPTASNSPEAVTPPAAAAAVSTPSMTTASDETTAESSAVNGHAVAPADGDTSTPASPTCVSSEEPADMKATEEGGSIPATEEGTSVPATEDGTSVPATEDGTSVPATEDGTSVPVTEDGTSVPATEEGTSVSGSDEGSSGSAADTVPPVEADAEAAPAEAAPTELDDLAELKMLAEQEALAKRDVKMVAGIRERIISKRYAVHEATQNDVRKRWSFEEGIKRPYFHVKPLERSQLKNWRDYLEFETKEGNADRVELLYERCVISCALYEDFWMKYVKYIESTKPDNVHRIYERACHIHLPKKPNIHLAWAAYEEAQGEIETARQILQSLDAAVPHIVLVKLHRISLERRHEFKDNTSKIFEEALAQSVSSEAFNFYSWRFARFLSKTCHDLVRARTVMEAAIEKDSGNKRLFQQLLSLELAQGDNVDEARVEVVFTAAQNSTLLSQNAKQGFAQRRLQFLEEFGTSPTVLMDAYESYQKLYKKSGGGSRKRTHGQDGGPSSKMPRLDGSVEDSQQASAFAKANQALQAMHTQPAASAAAAVAPQAGYAYAPVAGAAAPTAQQPWMQMQYATAGQPAATGYAYPAVAGQTWQYPQYQQ